MHITTTTRGGRVRRVAPGLAMPSPLIVKVEDFHGYDLELVLVPHAGRIAAESVKVKQRRGGPPVTSEAIRSVPVARLVREAAPALLSIEQTDSGAAAGVPNTSPDRIALLRAAGPVDETLRLVAHAYRVGLATGATPTKAVEETFNVSRATASRWISNARARGFLGPAEVGKAGEAHT